MILYNYRLWVARIRLPILAPRKIKPNQIHWIGPLNGSLLTRQEGWATIPMVCHLGTQSYQAKEIAHFSPHKKWSPITKSKLLFLSTRGDRQEPHKACCIKYINAHIRKICLCQNGYTERLQWITISNEVILYGFLYHMDYYIIWITILALDSSNEVILYIIWLYYTFNYYNSN